ncbi:hypothetical protein BD779DRAFT_1496354 [Infundibulicybe gibba]|nr:hypothetical protein BD779DRAFT_1496354 [Infundibulicybe gibba]
MSRDPGPIGAGRPAPNWHWALAPVGTSAGNVAQNHVQTEKREVSWESSPIYGLIHLKGCVVCDAYMAHMAESEREPSFQNALKKRDRERDEYFFDGIGEGRRRQRGDDEAIFQQLEQLRYERKCAKEAEEKCRTEQYEAMKELRVVQEQLKISRAECERLRERIGAPSGWDVAGGFKGQHEQDQPVKPLAPPAVYSKQSNHLSYPCNIAAYLEATLLADDIHQSSSKVQPEPANHPAIPEKPLHSSAQHESRPEADYTATPVAPLPTRASSSSSPPQGSSSYAAVASSWKAPPAPVAAHSITNPYTGRNPKNIRQMQALMTAAHKPGNDGALAKVKALCADAHLTPREQKTDLQRFLLSNWRSPSGSGTADVHAPQPSVVMRTNPRVDDPPEVWYEYLSVHQGSWPRGVRRDAHSRPIMSDLRASRTVARLRPEAETSGPGNTSPATGISRVEFMARVVQLFSAPGMYKFFVEKEDILIATTIAFKPYKGSPDITVRELVRHFADCGVTIEAAEREVEPWAKSYQASAPAVTT